MGAPPLHGIEGDAVAPRARSRESKRTFEQASSTIGQDGEPVQARQSRYCKFVRARSHVLRILDSDVHLPGHAGVASDLCSGTAAAQRRLAGAAPVASSRRRASGRVRLWTRWGVQVGALGQEVVAADL